MSQASKLDGGRDLEILRQNFPLAGNLLRRVIDGINRLATNVGAGSMGELDAPDPVQSTQVAGAYHADTNTMVVPGEILHWVHTHNSPVQRGIQYTTEIDTDPSFANAHPLNVHTSRSGFHPLPTKDGDGNVVDYYLRVTPQLPGSAPAKPTVFGTAQGPTKINFSGNTQMTLLTSQAAGTAKPGQTGKGLGPTQARGSVGGPKRDLR